MKGPVSLCIGVSFLIASIVPLTSALSAAETCKIVKNATYIADPSSCQGWAYCINGAPIFGKCKDGLLYESTSGTCEYADSVQCSTNVTTMCIGETDIYKSDPYNCQGYCYCKNGLSMCTTCPVDQNYDAVTTSCVWATPTNCQANSACLLAQNGFVKDPNGGCSDWLQCAGGQILKSGQCNPGYDYNTYTGMCDYPANVQCSGSSPGTPSTPSTPVADANLCDTGETFYSDGTTCRGYFYCAAVTDQPVWGQCPKGTNFNPVDQQCNNPEDVQCTHDRCDGSSNEFMAVAGNNCENYYYCKNGVKVAEYGCPEKYPYFNEVGKVCQSGPLKYPVCLYVDPSK